MASYRDIKVWQRGIDLTEQCYVATRDFPVTEVYGLISQIRRAAVSIPANVAEGYGRETPQSFVQFLRISQGSLKELETHILIAGRLRMLDAPTSERLLSECGEIGRMLRNLIRSQLTKPKQPMQGLLVH